MCNTVLLKCNGYVTCIGSKKEKTFASSTHRENIQRILGFCNDQSDITPSIEIKKLYFSFD